MFTLESVNMSQKHTVDFSEEEDTIEFKIGKLKSRLQHLRKRLDDWERELERRERMVDTLRRDIDACERNLSCFEAYAIVHKELNKEFERAKMCVYRDFQRI